MKRVHRDIKPANVYLRSEGGPAVLGDFGLCWNDPQGTRLTLEEAIGSFGFMAPEVRDGRVEAPSWHCDLYSLGKLTYSMLSGGPVFDREDHRTERWDLVRVRKDITLEHINNLLDQMITLDPVSRIDAKAVKNEAIQCTRLVAKEFAPLHGDIRSACKYCGLGTYVPIVWTDQEFQDFFGFLLGAVSNVQRKWRLVACNRCGNVQFFAMSILPDDWFPPKRQ